MCGIVGWIDPEAPDGPESRRRIQAMCDAIRHRGPDDDGVFIADGVALGMRRLSIVDLEGGAQPMVGGGGEVQLVFNGEIYNHAELRDGLAAEGVVFETQSDTEVILRLYERFGKAAFARLNGMFAIAIFDGRTGCLTLVRDRLGVKPLYYSFDGRRLLFASEIKAILEALPARPPVNPRAIWDYLTFRFVPAPDTIWQGIAKLEPAHLLTIERGLSREPVIERWWDMPTPGRTDSLDEQTLVQEFDWLLRDAVERRMRADVRVGVLLSGGLDSSVVAALAAKSHPRLATFAIAFEGADAIDERGFARDVAQHLGADHHEIAIGEKDVLDFLPDFVHATDEPLADLASIPLYYVSRLAREQVKVVLSGEGSDEILGGYSFDVWAGRWDQAAEQAGTLANRSRLARYLSATPAMPDPGLLDLRQTPQPLTMTAYMTSKEKQALLRTVGGFPDSHDRPRRDLATYGDASPLAQALYTYCQDWLVEDLLMKADKMSMANSLELRTPFLDYRLVEMAAHLPDALRVGRDRSGQYRTKRILREIAAQLIPRTVIERSKMGFPVPLYDWLKDRLQPLARDCLSSGQSRLR
ncbi:MAG: asparagine synthase (glutamine-hydrolyzing), partial [Geminicoccaceae bacterium]